MLEKKVNTISDQLVDILRKKILSGQLAPGSRLSEIKIAQEFGISRVPAREALITLEEQNLVKKTSNGREVLKISPLDLRDLFELKIALESYAVLELAKQFTDRMNESLQNTINRCRTCLKPLNVKTFHKWGSKFHDLLVHFYGNKALQEAYSNTVNKIRWSSTLSLEIPAQPAKTIREHQHILACLRKKDGLAAAALLRDHSTGSMKRILDKIQPASS